ncbi:unnamed protein product [Paramecium primaurelia]|uniref:Uncharacterized protein n=2 Tax=Paramecium TaxID=5884 RepID=A0A8S1UWD7_9CILI|nr:unnamed protein product [Paramecium primaurelia]CAD8167869.1 unnamed protein product [Paramecium pentaurelia]
MIHTLYRLIPRFRFATTLGSSNVASGNQTSATQSNPIPVYLRPYEAKKYEVPSSKIKLTTGYSFLDVEPMPRAKIMKLCYTILDKLKAEIPEGVLYRIYTEEKLKYIMRITDEIEDIRQLEEEFGFEQIEFLIQQLAKEVDLVDQMKYYKPWEKTQDDSTFELLRQPHPALKHQRNEKPSREQTKFIGN